MGILFFSNPSNTLSVGYVAIVAELSLYSPIIYVWNTPILAYLHRSLDHRCVIRTRSMSITGFWKFLQYWYYEYFRNMTYPTLDSTLSLLFSRVGAWIKENRRMIQRGEARHIFIMTRNQIELHITRESIIWHLYEGSPFFTNETVLHADFLFLKLFPLVSPPPQTLGCYWFLSECSWRQTMEGDMIPSDPHWDTPFLKVYGSAAL